MNDAHGTEADHAEAHAAGGAPQDRKALHDHLRHEVHHYAHMLSEQGPMNITFVHNNTLLGLQHLHFEAAIAEANRVLGASGYEPIKSFRAHYARGRITDKDLDRAINERQHLELDTSIARHKSRDITRREVIRAALLWGADPVAVPTLRYAVESEGALARLQLDLPDSLREALAARAQQEFAGLLARIGQDLTLSDLVGRLLGLDLSRAIRRAAISSLDPSAPLEANAESLLLALEIPAAQRAGYVGCLDAWFSDELRAGPEQRDAIRLAALTEEHALLGEICRRHWNIAGTFTDVSRLFSGNGELYASLSLWRAALASQGLEDPFSPTDTLSLQSRDDERDRGEAEAVQARMTTRVGGVAPTMLDARLRTLVQDLLDHAVLRGGEEHSLEVVQEQFDEARLDAAGVAAARQLALSSDFSDAQALIAAFDAADPKRERDSYVADMLSRDFATMSRGRTHLDWLQQLTGIDLGDDVNQSMIRACAAFLDEGLAAWHMPDRDAGFFSSWRRVAEDDLSFRLDGLEGWDDELDRLPAQAEDAVIHLLGKLGVPFADWGEYLGRTLARLKGWAGMVYWYELHPQQYKQAVQRIDTVQYLAVRLFHEWLLVRQTCRRLWGLDGQLEEIRRHFEIHGDEYLARRELYAGRLPDMLADRARRELDRSGRNRGRAQAVRNLADAVWTHCVELAPMEKAAVRAWPLFRLSQALGLTGSDLQGLGATGANALLAVLEQLPDSQLAPIWLRAYECHYRDEVLNAISQNHGRGRWAKGRTRRPRSQVVFCIDEREENLHRHYAELDPDHETLGAAGFFGVAQSFIALDDHDPTPLCPAVATPAHRILEIPRMEALRAEYPVHKRRFKWKEIFDGTYWETKRNVAGSFFLIELVGFLMALPLLGRVFAPHAYGRVAGAIGSAVVPPVRTRLTHVRMEEGQLERMGLHTHGLPVGFQIPEAADRVEAQLRNWGLTYQFARIVVICAHRSISVNNPHENAHDCGACGGKAGGPNSRLFAALANDPQVREELRRRGIDIPDDTWFIGAEHNTANDAILAADTEDLPASLRSDWQLVSADLEEARRRAARERCRRFGSAPKDSSIDVALKHVEARTQDLSQVRPEWGHCTNAFAIVGRRCVTQGLFFDRRGFVISYDPTQDADGKIVERILLAVGPVGAGINLEYYFSTVDPDNYGCGTKVPHNVTGMIGVMAGAHGDLQTGLPRQMTEVHEAMRLQLIVDAKMSVLGEIYGRQPGIRQLLDNQWVHLIAHDPDTGELNLFVPGKGFEKWAEPPVPFPEVSESYDWYRGKHECFLPPCRIAEPTARWTQKAKVH